MTQSLALDRAESALRTAETAQSPRLRVADDATMLRTAADLTRDINAARPLIYWTDFLGSTVIGYASLAAAILVSGPLPAIAAALVAILALYRAGSFIHELTHIKHSAVPGFRLVWNLLIGIPLLVPSFLYEGVHTQHHARTRYGTADDPEYLPLALMKPWTVPLFVAAAMLAPLALLVRFGVLAPVSLVSPKLRETVIARYSALSINPAYRRRAPDGELKRQWAWQETGAALWSIAFVGLTIAGVITLKAFLVCIAIASAVAVLNQVRTLVAHLWENEGEPMSVTAQYLDTVNVPPPALLPVLWAPVGLRYHALHHLLPSLPYHALGEAHRRLAAALDPASPYHRASHAGLPGLVARLVGSTLRRGTA